MAVFSVPMHFIFTHYISNERESISLFNDMNYQKYPRKMVNKKHYFHFYFLNKDISLNIQVKILKFSPDVKNIHMEGSLSQIFYLGFSSCFTPKNG